uniref:Uncharacterized protein n=1 Tax=Arion vulgaris TaxID=1028688 RepID=A0A0B7BWS8_9EUPU
MTHNFKRAVIQRILSHCNNRYNGIAVSLTKEEKENATRSLSVQIRERYHRRRIQCKVTF